MRNQYQRMRQNLNHTVKIDNLYKNKSLNNLLFSNSFNYNLNSFTKFIQIKPSESKLITFKINE